MPENYRPVSLTSVCSKILEHIVHSSVCQFLEENHILTYRQHGFRRGYSCDTQLVSVVNDWATSLNSSVRTDVAIFDFSKAFDSVPHRRLHAKLQSYGINGRVLAWITAFLSNRCQRVTLKGSQSSWKSVTSGVPQGTVLGPLLFLIYINDIVENLSSEIRLFADDCILYREIRLPADNLAMQKDIDTLHNWSLLWQMSFNSKKCHTMCISRKRVKPLLSYKLGQESLSTVDSYPYLGVTISSDLRWTLHVNHISARATRVLNLLRRNIYSCSADTKALAYTSLVRPHLEFASAAWDPYTQADSHKMDKVQRRAARFVNRDYRHTSSATQMMSKLGWEALADRRRTTRLSLFYKGLHGLAPVPVDQLRHPSRFTRHSTTSTFIPLSSRIDAFKYSFIPRTVVDWNSLPDENRLKPTLSSFLSALPSCY